MKRLIHTPEGVRDIYGQECDKKRYLQGQIEKLFRSYGYQSIETPSFEFFDVFSKGWGTISSKDLYKFFDREGNTLVLRPDFTPSIARAVSMYFSEENMPIRLCYEGSVFINNSSYQGRAKESTQMGVEFLNEDSPESDAEIISLVVSTMKKAELSDFQVSIGSSDFFYSLVKEALMTENTIIELRKLLTIKNRFGAQELIEKLKLRKDLEKAFLQISNLFGNSEILLKAMELTENVRARAAICRLEKIHEILIAYGCEKFISYDLSLLSNYEYYTGIIFQAYTYGSGSAVIKGGRYNNCLEKFGKKAPAIGFTTEVDSLLNAIERQNIHLPIVDIKTMVLYPEHLESLAIHCARLYRKKKLDVACIRFDPEKVLDDYQAYGKRNQFGEILYFNSETELYAIDLSSGKIVPMDISIYCD
ncbi:MAG: ATP phosphoribosyltransferase regulatory subunit [Lachnospiraceae bacterium]|nr:ATP phosphoribosyltransferase regulatory subunit [Lachnospiraceae bacterium]